MGKEKLGLESAFARAGALITDKSGERVYNKPSYGMTQRLLIAKDAMCALITAHGSIRTEGIDNECIVNTALRITDKLLEEENK